MLLLENYKKLVYLKSRSYIVRVFLHIFKYLFSKNIQAGWGMSQLLLHLSLGVYVIKQVIFLKVKVKVTVK